jgi:hypothetical protein
MVALFSQLARTAGELSTQAQGAAGWLSGRSTNVANKPRGEEPVEQDEKILQLVAQGYTNQQIAALLGMDDEQVRPVSLGGSRSLRPPARKRGRWVARIRSAKSRR